MSAHFITDLSISNMVEGVTDPRALLTLCMSLPRMEIRHLPRLHAKVFVADLSHAIVTSSNLTDSGLLRNFEYGMLIANEPVVDQIRTDLLMYGDLGSVIEIGTLKAFASTVEDLRDIKARTERTVNAKLSREFRRRFHAATQEMLATRVTHASSHGVFAKTILYLLQRGAQDTRAIYREVKRIHPDLCDDNVKLVIGGEMWNQAKWRHQVRHAQLHLRRTGRIRRNAGKWSLCS